MREVNKTTKAYLKVIVLTVIVCYIHFFYFFSAHNKSDSPECSSGFVPFEKTKSCYKVHHEEMDFEDAFDTCFDEKSLLLWIISQEESDFVAKLFNKPMLTFADHQKEVWIGLIAGNFLNLENGSVLGNGTDDGTVMDTGAPSRKWKNVKKDEQRGVVCKKLMNE